MSDEDPIRWSEGSGPPGSMELVRAIERAPVLPPDLGGSIARRLARPRAPVRTRMIGPAVATSVVLGGIALWVWQRPAAPRVIEPAVEPLAIETVVEPIEIDATAAEPVAIDPAVVAGAPPPTPTLAPPARSATTTPRPRSIPDAPFVAPDEERTATSVAALPDPTLPDAALEACITDGNSRCIIRLLGGGRAHGQAQLRALWNAERDVGDRVGACATVRELLSRPGTSAAQRAMMEQYQRAQCERATPTSEARTTDAPFVTPEAVLPSIASPAPRPAPLAGGTGYLVIQSLPWARVFVDGRDTGRDTPVRELRVPSGRHRIGLRTPDGAMHEWTIDVYDGETTRVVRQL